MKISIVCPIYTMKDRLAEKFLVDYCSQFFYQSHRDFELVFSDQSEGDNLKQIVDTFKHVYDITYVKNTSGINNAANNVNHAIPHAKGDIVKLLYMDDFFIDSNALQKINYAFSNHPGKWLIAGFGHCNQDRTKFWDFRKPWYGNKYVNGDNTTGNPSNSLSTSKQSPLIILITHPSIIYSKMIVELLLKVSYPIFYHYAR